MAPAAVLMRSGGFRAAALPVRSAANSARPAAARHVLVSRGPLPFIRQLPRGGLTLLRSSTSGATAWAEEAVPEPFIVSPDGTAHRRVGEAGYDAAFSAQGGPFTEDGLPADDPAVYAAAAAAAGPVASKSLLRTFWETFGAIIVALPLVGALGTIAASASAEPEVVIRALILGVTSVVGCGVAGAVLSAVVFSLAMTVRSIFQSITGTAAAPPATPEAAAPESPYIDPSAFADRHGSEAAEAAAAPQYRQTATAPAAPASTAESAAAAFLKGLMAVAGAIAVASAAGMAIASQPSLMIPRTLSQLTACAVGVGTALVVVAGSVFGAVWLFSMTWRVIAGTPGPAAAGASGAKEAPQEPTLSPEDWERHFREQQAQRGRAAHAQPQPQHRRQSPPPPPAAEAAAGPSDSAPWGAASEEFDAAGSFARRQQAASAPSSHPESTVQRFDPPLNVLLDMGAAALKRSAASTATAAATIRAAPAAAGKGNLGGLRASDITQPRTKPAAAAPPPPPPKAAATPPPKKAAPPPPRPAPPPPPPPPPPPVTSGRKSAVLDASAPEASVVPRDERSQEGRWQEMKRQRLEWAERIERAAGARYRTLAQQQQDAAAEAAAAAAFGGAAGEGGFHGGEEDLAQRAR